MSYSTILYAIDMNRLQASLGAKDASLFEAVKKLDASNPIEPNQVQQIWVVAFGDGSIFLNRDETSIENVELACSTLGYRDEVHLLCRNMDIRTRLMKKIPGVDSEGRSHGPSIELHSPKMDLEEFYAFKSDTGEIDNSGSEVLKAVDDLLNGKTSTDRSASKYGYALQQLCRVIGRELDDDDAIGEIAPLQLETRLDEPREVPGVPSDDDFPLISYLTPMEVNEEIARLDESGILYPRDIRLEAARVAFLRCLKEASKDNLSVISFYY